MQWFGKAVPQNRFLGQVDQDDPTNLPMGLAALCKNFDFTRDSGGPTCATTRAGINTAMQCLDPNAPVTGAFGFVYEPVSATDPPLNTLVSGQAQWQRPLAFQPTQGSQYEQPLGTGRMVKFPQTNFTEPSVENLEALLSHAIQASAGNKVFTAYSNLISPLSGLSTMDPKALTLNPFGMKPFGWNWLPQTPILEMEVATPSAPLTGNGHTYQAQNAGYTGLVEPAWPLTEGGEVTEVLSAAQIAAGYTAVTWKEKTMVIANRLPPPASPALSLNPGNGTINANQDVYIVITISNSSGETLPSVPAMITTLVNDSAVNVPIPALNQLPGWEQALPPVYIPTSASVYVAIVAHGSAAPALSTYNQVVSGAMLGSTVVVANSGTGSGTQYGGGPQSVALNIPPSSTLTQYSGVISGFPNLAAAGSLLTLVMSAQVNLSGPGGGAVVFEVSPDSGVTWDAAYTFTVTGGPVSLTIPIPGAPANLDTVQIRIEASGGTGPTGDLNLLGNLLNSYITVPSAPLSPPIVCTARVTPGQLPTPTALVNIDRDPGAGSFPAGQDVYILQTYTNALGETPAGPATAVVDTNANDAVQVTVAQPLGPDNEQLYRIASIGIYEADVPTGSPAPPSSAFSLVQYAQSGAVLVVGGTANGSNPPLTNTTGPGGAIAADTATGGANGTQGYRFGGMGWINQMETFSGFTLASIVSTIIDLYGYEIGAFNVLTGMPNVIGRYIFFTVADSSQAGPFNWIGLVDIEVPTQNVVYPAQTLIDQVNQSATVFLDNTTTQGTFNFTDTYLIAENNVDDRLDVTTPPTGARIDYLASVDRVAITGVPGLASGAWISLGEDYESFYGDDSPVPITTNGERCFGVTDKYKGIPFALMEESGFTLSPNTGNPESWAAQRRWDGMGPCGFRAWDANGKMIVFAHRSGAYKYDESDPDMMQKEIPKLWSSINWNACQNIDVTIDEDTHTVHFLVPTNGSMTPNEDIVLSYIEGWQNPIHFSTFSGKEISMDAARRWSWHDVSAYVCLRMKRTLPNNGNAYLNGPGWNTLPDSSYQLTQLLFASSGPDGTIQARTPGIFSDNGRGIDWQYETMSTGMMQAVCKPEGFNLNACGQGNLIPSFIASRAEVSDQGGEQVLIQQTDELPMDPVPLTPRQIAGITGKCGPSINEFWRVRMTGDKQPGTWVSMKALTVYVIPFTVGRDQGDR